MKRKGVVIYPGEFTEYWLDLIKDTDINFIGIHPLGGQTYGKSTAELIEWVKKSETQALIKKAEALGICIEFEIHALSWLLPRTLIVQKPEWFRMNEQGERVADYHCCPSNPELLDYLSCRAEELAKTLNTSSGHYHFWLDDVPHPKCYCERCRELSASDEAITIYNALNRGVRRFNENGGVSYLAYNDAIIPPIIKPDNGIFLEYAPMCRNITRPMCDSESELNKKSIAPLNALFEIFGTENSQVLDYWLDNSWFSDWKRPIRRFSFPADVVRLDSAWYEKQGFETISCFACMLGEEYEKVTGDRINIKFFSECLGPVSKKADT